MRQEHGLISASVANDLHVPKGIFHTGNGFPARVPLYEAKIIQQVTYMHSKAVSQKFSEEGLVPSFSYHFSIFKSFL